MIGAFLLGCLGVGFIIFGGCVVAILKPGTGDDGFILLGLFILIGGGAAIYGAIRIGFRAAAQRSGPPPPTVPPSASSGS